MEHVALSQNYYNRILIRIDYTWLNGLKYALLRWDLDTVKRSNQSRLLFALYKKAFTSFAVIFHAIGKTAWCPFNCFHKWLNFMVGWSLSPSSQLIELSFSHFSNPLSPHMYATHQQLPSLYATQLPVLHVWFLQARLGHNFTIINHNHKHSALTGASVLSKEKEPLRQLQNYIRINAIFKRIHGNTYMWIFEIHGHSPFRPTSVHEFKMACIDLVHPTTGTYSFIWDLSAPKQRFFIRNCRATQVG